MRRVSGVQARICSNDRRRDFDPITPGHGDVIETDGRGALAPP
jgi:hypothetical protein